MINGKVWFGCVRGVSLERRKEYIGRKNGGKKCCNGRENMKNIFEEMEWRAHLKRFWDAKEPGREKEMFARQADVVRGKGGQRAMGYRRLWRRNLCGVSGKCNECGWGYNELMGGSCVKEFVMVVSNLDGERYRVERRFVG